MGGRTSRGSHADSHGKTWNLIGKTYTFTPISRVVHATSREGVPPGSHRNLLEGPKASPPVHEYRPQDTSGIHMDE